MLSYSATLNVSVVRYRARRDAAALAYQRHRCGAPAPRRTRVPSDRPQVPDEALQVVASRAPQLSDVLRGLKD